MFVAGIPASMSFGAWADVTLFGRTIFGLMDYTATNLLLPLGGIFIALFTGWVIWPKAAAQVTARDGRIPVWATGWRLICRWIAPAVIAWILIIGL